MKKIFVSLLFFISCTAFSQDAAVNPTQPTLITLAQFVEGLKLKNESIKNAESVNVMVNDLLIENLQDYQIDPKNISRMEILVLEPKVASQQRTKPSIIITTKIK